MILTGINFSSKYVFIAIKNEKENKINHLKGLQNMIYYKNGQILTQQQVLQENSIDYNNYIPNLYNLLKQCYTDETQIQCINKQISLERNIQNGMVVNFQKQNGQKSSIDIEEIIEDFFVHIIQLIRSSVDDTELSKEIVTVLTASDTLNEDQKLSLKQSAQKAGFSHVKIVSEVICASLNQFYQEKFQFNWEKYFLMCIIGQNQISFHQVKFKDKLFWVLKSSNSDIIKQIKLDEQLFDIVFNSFKDEYPNCSFKDYLMLQNITESVKFFFSKNQSEDDQQDLKSLLVTYNSYSQIGEEKDEEEQYWHAVYKDIDLYIDQDTYEDLIPNSFLLQLQNFCQNFLKKTKKFENIVFTGSMANVYQIRNTILDVFKINQNKINNYLLTYVSGAVIWCEKLYSLNPNPILSNVLDEEQSPNLKNSIGVMVWIPNFDGFLNKVIINKNTFVPLQQKVELRLNISENRKNFEIYEGEGILVIENKLIKQIDLSDIVKKEGLVDISIDLDANYIFNISIKYEQKVKNIKFKYIPQKQLTRKNSFSLINSNENLMKMKLRAMIAEWLYSYNQNYKLLVSRAIKQKFQQKVEQLQRFECFYKNNFFGIKKLEKVISEINDIIDK